MASGYHQIPMRPEDKEKKEFLCHRGHFQFMKMPFGLNNALATYQRCIDVVLMGLKGIDCLVYLDDIICFSATMDEHAKKLRNVFERLDLYGGLPTSRSGVKYILVCYDVFSKHVKLYPLKAATTTACLNTLINKYFGEVNKPKVIMSDNGSQFRSPSWRRKWFQNEVEVRFSPVRHPQSNPSERVIKELSKFCRIYCHHNHKRLADLLPQMERWLNITVSSSTGYAPVELIFYAQRPDIFAKFLTELGESPENEDLAAKVLKAYIRMKEVSKRDSRRKLGNSRWTPRIIDKVLCRPPPTYSICTV